MKIHKHGDARKIKETRYFCCSACGCEFEADKGEYRAHQKDYDGSTEYLMNCPECNEVCEGMEARYNYCSDHGCDNKQQTSCCGCAGWKKWVESGSPDLRKEK